MVPLGFWRKNKIGDKKFGNNYVKKKGILVKSIPYCSFFINSGSPSATGRHVYL